MQPLYYYIKAPGKNTLTLSIILILFKLILGQIKSKPYITVNDPHGINNTSIFMFFRFS